MKKGFTLVEMLAVITILAILALITVPLVGKQFTDSSNTLYEAQIENIKEGAKNWAADHLEQVPSVENGTVTVTLKDLQDGGYVVKNLENPKLKKNFDPTIGVQIAYLGGNYTYRVLGDNLVKFPNQGTKGWAVSTNTATGGSVSGSNYLNGDISGFKINVATQSTTWLYALAQLDTTLLKKNITYIVEFDIISNKNLNLSLQIMNSNATSPCTNAVSTSIAANKTNHVKVEMTTVSNVTFAGQGLYINGLNVTGGEFIIYNENIYEK